jgi:hypothetical protein
MSRTSKRGKLFRKSTSIVDLPSKAMINPTSNSSPEFSALGIGGYTADSTGLGWANLWLGLGIGMKMEIVWNV